MRTKTVALGAAAAMTVTGWIGVDAGLATEDDSGPTVEGPVTGGVHGHPWFDPAFETGSIGYVEEEFFVAGDARDLVNEADDAAYKTRTFVVRPAAQEDFNGTVVVEWDNVTAQAAFSPMFTWLHPLLLRDGYAFVSVSAQAAAICCSPLSHNVWDPVRYGDLHHPGDDYSFDIYAQAVAAVREHPEVMEGLSVERVIATGQSQSASRLHTYVNDVHDDPTVNALIDAFYIDAGGSRVFDTGKPTAPTIHFMSEDQFGAAEPSPSVADNPHYRFWEVPGASHNDADTARHIDFGQAQRNAIPQWPKQPYEHEERLHEHVLHYGEQGPSSHASCQPIGQGGNEYPRRYANMAALDDLDEHLLSGDPMQQPPRVEYDEAGNVVRDGFGHPLGGVRLPPLDVPVARYFATTCALFGHTVALDPLTLLELYPDHDAYVEAFRAAADDALAEGWLLPEDRDELLGYAERSHIPLWMPTPG